MQLFYQRGILPTASEVVFDKEESRHISKVLRKRIGDELFLTNGLGGFFKLELISDYPKKCVAKVVYFEEKPKRKISLHLAVAPTKNNDRYEWFLEKATEIGVEEITPIICENSERTIIKEERFEKILVSAMKQSLQYYLPKLNPTIKLSNFLEYLSGSNIQKFIAHCEETDRKVFSKELFQSRNDSVLVLIGPEGDFSTKEINLAKSLDFKSITLGNTRLRTETAGVVACHTFSVIGELY